MQARQEWSLPCRGNMGDVLSSLSYPYTNVPFVSSVLQCRSPREATPHEGLLCWPEICFLLLVDEDGPLKWPRSRWIGIPQNQYTDSSPREPGPLTCPLDGVKGQGPPRSYWALQQHASTLAVRRPCEDAEAGTRWSDPEWRDETASDRALRK
jgi:hypothetical protein